MYHNHLVLVIVVLFLAQCHYYPPSYLDNLRYITGTLAFASYLHAMKDKKRVEFGFLS